MTTPTLRVSFSQGAWIVWGLLVSLMLMFLGSLGGARIAMAIEPPPPVSLFSMFVTFALVGMGLGIAVGGFRGLWAQREIGHPQFRRWIGVNISMSVLGVPFFVWAVNTLFGELNCIDLLASTVMGLCYGMIFGSVAVLGEWLAIRKYAQTLGGWFSMGWIGWVIWWMGVGYFLGVVSWMD